MKHADTSLRGKRLTAFTITIVLILTSIFTASSLFVLAQSRNGDDTPVIGTIPDGEQGSTVTIRPALDDETLIGQTTSFWQLTDGMARDSLTDAGVPASVDPVGQLVGMVKTVDASTVMRILSAVKARATDGTHDPVGVFKGEGSARIMDGVYFAAGSQGSMTVFHTPDTLYMAGLVDTGHVTEQDAVEAQQRLVTPDTSDKADSVTSGDSSVDAKPSDTTADAVFTPAVFRSAPTGAARNVGYDNNDLNNSRFQVYNDYSARNGMNYGDYFLYGSTDNGMRIVCIDPLNNTPNNGAWYYARTVTEADSLGGDHDSPVPLNVVIDNTNGRTRYQRLQNTLYWGYGGPGYTPGVQAAKQGGSPYKDDGTTLYSVIRNAYGLTQGKDDETINLLAQFYTHLYVCALLGRGSMNNHAFPNGIAVKYQGTPEYKAIITNFLEPKSIDDAGGQAKHMELVELRPEDKNNVNLSYANLGYTKYATAQWMIGFRWHDYNLSITTQTWASSVAQDSTGKEYAKPNTADKNAIYGENLPCKTSQAADGTWSSNDGCFHFYESVHDAIVIHNNGASDKPNDHWNLTVWFNMLTPNGKDPKTGKEGTHYSMTLNSIDFSEKIAANGGSYTFNSSDVNPSVVIKKGNKNLLDDYGHPYNENEEGHWPRNSKFWFDVTMGPMAGATVYGSAESLHEGASRDPKSGVTKRVTLTDDKEAFSTPGTRLGLKTETRSNGGKAPALGTTQGILDHLHIYPLDSVLSGGQLNCEFTLKYSATDYGKDVKASKVKTHAEPILGTWPQDAAQSGLGHELDSPVFKPSDLGMTVWKEGYYWFDVTVKRTGVATPGLIVDAYEHAGASDQKERFPLRSGQYYFMPSITSQTVDANGKNLGSTTPLHDGAPSRDTLTATIASESDFSLPNLTLKAHGTLWWSKTPGTDGNKPADAKQVAQLTPQSITTGTCNKNAARIMTCTGRTTYDPSKDPKLKGKLTGYGTGYYTYVWQLEKADYTTMKTSIMVGNNIVSDSHSVADLLRFPSNGIISDGWRPAREQTQQDAQWNLSFTKTTCTGNTSSACKWDKNQLIQGAKFALTETDASWKTKRNGQTINLTTGKDGKASTGIQHIGSGETRYYTLTETSVPRPYAKPRNGVWHVTVTQTPGTKGARITMQATGDALQNGTTHAASGTLTANTATGVQNQAETWTVEIGNLRPISAMPPQTGWAHDAGRLLAIGIITTIVTGMGIAFALHRRHTHVKNMGRHEA